jgi:hypothetical protein
MAKKPEYYAEAELMYVQDRLTFEQISDKIGVSERTLRTWAKDGDWSGRRESIEDVRSKSHDKLHKIMDLLLDKAIEALGEGKEPNQAQLNFIKAMSPSLVRLQNYEDKAMPVPASDGDKAAAAARYETVIEEMTKTMQQLGLA